MPREEERPRRKTGTASVGGGVPGRGLPTHDDARRQADTETASLRTALIRAERERDVAHSARDAAEVARDCAEQGRRSSDIAADEAREISDILEDQVMSMQEQVRSARNYRAQVTDPEVAELRVERQALLQEIAIMGQELQAQTGILTAPRAS